MEQQKYTREQLLEYYRTNNKYFMELANYYYKNDPDFYRATVLPIIEQNKDASIAGIKILFDTYNKPTGEQLLEYYKTNNKYFMNIADYAYKNDKEYYTNVVYPIFITNKSGSVTITCPFCHNTVTPIKNSKISTGGIVMIVAGILLAPVLIGIVMIFIGVAMKDNYSVCPMCRMKLG
jgi:hypothetical protein